MSNFEIADVAIVGAGPAGAWAAQRLAGSGARVALFDPSHPREKPCGGGITGRALELVHACVSPITLPAVEIAAASFIHRERAAGVTLTADGSGYPPLVVAARREFDSALLAAATAAGARHHAVRVTSLSQQRDAWVIGTREGSHRAAWLLGADGTNSFVRRHVAAPFARADLSIATGYFVQGTSSRDIVVAFEDEPAGYLWSFPRPDHLAVGICAQADRTTANELLARARGWIERHVPMADGVRLERYSWPIPSLTARALSVETPSGDRWMLAGDAAGLVDPITREGIYFALRSGEMAAEALIAGVNAAAHYAACVRDEIHGELLRAAQLRARFYRPRFIELLLKGLARSRPVREVMADLVAGRQAYRGLRRRLLKTAEWRLMLELFGF
jgi:geranylgeranyl diphosphate/geranylgeranyl-bacteriochlorophyllide a reductase